MQSKLIIGHDSTALREAFSFNKKILSCQFIEHKKFFPYQGLSLLNECSYEALKILNLSYEEYNLSVKKIDYIMKNTLNTANIIRKRLL